jgi:hypothetical protein
MSNLSGKSWWRLNQGKYVNSRDVADLDPDFQEGVVQFIRLLRDAGANVAVSSTLRSPIRAYLMHYSWRIDRGDIDPADVPPKDGVSIEWDHGNEEASRQAAREMVQLFNLAYKPSLTSNHIKGKAIDMTITWTGDLSLGPLPDGSYRQIDDGPRNGALNRDLHEVGALYGVRKMLSDPPHWSYNGR